ncbi:protein of unknown function [Bradyrhizobium vignae]|uniref:Uncharacterized protein n=1 Tax=Bradyrhizobium vignae TaxID=1549949 RepID=A0A2U3Q688_9BRAD|nr:protein of unknown function [Bradyrhizobium vignae]
MTTAPARHITSPLAASDRSGPLVSPRIKLYKRRIAISHPDPQAGERLLAEALGAADRDALQGMLRQLVKASAVGQRPDEANLAFMISTIRSIAPKDSIEAMLVSQMVSVHVAAMRCACRLACTDDLAQQEGVTRALIRRPGRSTESPPQQRRAPDHGTEPVGAGRRTGDRGQRHAACECDRCGDRHDGYGCGYGNERRLRCPPRKRWTRSVNGTSA